jgi:carboxymethylenebutenolidase
LIKPNDPRLKSEFISYDYTKGGVKSNILYHNHKKKLPGIILVHENLTLNSYIEDVGRRAAVEEFITLAPDALSPFGGYRGNDDEERELQKKRSCEEMLEDFIAAREYLK